MGNNLHNRNESNNNTLPTLEEVRSNSIERQHNSNNEIRNLSNDCDKNKKFSFLDLNNIITFERILEIILKVGVVIFIASLLINQISFFKDLILGAATGKYKLDSTTLQIVSSALILEFAFAMKIVINSLFPESDRKNALDFMKNKNPDNNQQNNQPNNISPQ